MPDLSRAYESSEQTTREAMTDLLSPYPGVIVSVVHGFDHACATLNRRGTQWKVTLERVPAERCAYMGCEHPASTHGPDGCTVERLDYYERRFTAEGDRIPPRMRPCGCPEWRERTRVTPRLPREVLAEATAHSRDMGAPGAAS